ncbi:hypothetical protein HYQ46_012644 [Verticillium longisporum]|nr:hypothetical protein HYQ46_012644 [Verticillium longisporum]
MLILPFVRSIPADIKVPESRSSTARLLLPVVSLLYKALFHVVGGLVLFPWSSAETERRLDEEVGQAAVPLFRVSCWHAKLAMDRVLSGSCRTFSLRSASLTGRATALGGGRMAVSDMIAEL